MENAIETMVLGFMLLAVVLCLFFADGDGSLLSYRKTAKQLPALDDEEQAVVKRYENCSESFVPIFDMVNQYDESAEKAEKVQRQGGMKKLL